MAARDGGNVAQPLVWQPALDRGELVIVLVRHGQTAWNAEHRFLGCTDIPLDAVGEAQAEALGRWLPRRFDRVYSSPLQRALSTARALDVAPIPVPELAELRQGELEGLCRDEAIARFPDFFRAWVEDSVNIQVPGGESLAFCQRRAVLALERLREGHTGGQLVGVVTHQMVIASLSCMATGESLQRWREHGVPNATMTVLAWDGARYEVLARGLHPHEDPQRENGS